ncbi:MAG: M23 family metallopeptidase [Bacteroidales bacterium]|nr:M23 family metallopeptidase [Bacteroidales bacterium]
MKKSKFKYNYETLSFEPVRRNFKAMLRTAVSFIFSTTFIVILAAYLLFHYIKSPKEIMLERELENMEFNYNVLTDRMANLEAVLQDLQERDDNIYRVILEADPIHSSAREGVYGGVERYAKLANYTNSQLIINTTKRLDKIASQTYVQSKSFDEVFQLATQKEEMLVSIPGILPTNKANLVSFFGMRPHPRYKMLRMHTGVDFSAPTGTPIYVTGNGVVESVKYQGGYGNTIVVDHGFNYKTLYGHLSSMSVRPGQTVKRGQQIGKIGNTGNSVGPHLHYEVHYKGVPKNPINFFAFDLTPAEYNEILHRSQSMGQSLD